MSEHEDHIIDESCYWAERMRITPTLLFICGASAVGKTTLTECSIEYLKQRGVNAKKPVGYTTREKREGEEDGVDYYFVTPQQFYDGYYPRIADDPEAWDVDEIGGNFYFNRLDDTVPCPGYPVSILPISLDVCSSMVHKYVSRYPELNVQVFSVMLHEQNVREWELRMARLRPLRDALGELSLNDTFVPPLGVSYQSFAPTWSIEYDMDRFTDKIFNELVA